MAQPSNNETHVKKRFCFFFFSLSLSLFTSPSNQEGARSKKKWRPQQQQQQRRDPFYANYANDVYYANYAEEEEPRRHENSADDFVSARRWLGAAFLLSFFLRFSFVLFYRVVTEFRSATSSKRLTRFSVDFFLFILVLVGFFFCSISSSFCCRLSAIAPPPTDATRRSISHSRSLFPCKNSRQ